MVLFVSMRLCVLALASLFFTSAHGQGRPGVQSQQVSILSWNIYMLPGFLGVGKTQRSEIIGKLLKRSSYDVIVFQEAFHGPARKRIRQQLKELYPFEAGPANSRTFSLRTNSGLWVLSKFPIVSQQEIVFDTRQGIDAMSRKGALLVELNVNGQHIQVIATHLQNAGHFAIKQNQCRELFHKLLRQMQRLGVPQIICGDFNIDRHASPDSYKQMLAVLQANDCDIPGDSFSYDRLNNDLSMEPGTKRELIDFILTRNNDSGLQRLDQCVKIFREQWRKRHVDLSDHYAMEAVIELQRIAPVVASTVPAY